MVSGGSKGLPALLRDYSGMPVGRPFSGSSSCFPYRTCSGVFVYLCACVYVRVCMCVCVVCLCVRARACVRVCVCVCIYMCMSVCVCGNVRLVLGLANGFEKAGKSTEANLGLLACSVVAASAPSSIAGGLPATKLWRRPAAILLHVTPTGSVVSTANLSSTLFFAHPLFRNRTAMTVRRSDDGGARYIALSWPPRGFSSF